MKAILISGSYRNNVVNQNIINFLNNNIVNNKNIVFVASTFENYEVNDKFVNKLCLAFKDKK